MSRPLRIQYPGAVYHGINRGRAGSRRFVGETDDQDFLDTMSEAHRQWGVEVFAYCLMGTLSSVCENPERQSILSHAPRGTASIPSDSTGATVAKARKLRDRIERS